MSRLERQKYALADYTVELREQGWYFGQPYQTASEYRGPYRSITSLSLVIARQHRREIERRHRADSERRLSQAGELPTTAPST